MGMPTGSVTVQLVYPVMIELESREITEVTMRRPKVKDQRAAQAEGGTDADVEIRLMAMLCELPATVIDEFDIADFLKLQDAYRAFLD